MNMDEKDKDKVIARAMESIELQNVKIEALLDLLKRALATSHEKMMRASGLTDWAAQIAERVAARTSQSISDVLEKALILYESALEEEVKGNHLAFLNKDDDVVREIVGLARSSPAVGPSSGEVGHRDEH